MRKFIYDDWLSFWRKVWPSALVFSWCFGLSCGFWLVSPAESQFYLRMYALILQRGSILGLLAVNVLPFLISAVAIRFRISYLIILIVFLKSFLCGYCRCCILYAFGGAGWLIAFLLLFSESGSVVFLIWFWIRNINRTGNWHMRELCCFISACSVLSIIEYLLVRPFLVLLMV